MEKISKLYRINNTNFFFNFGNDCKLFPLFDNCKDA